MLRMQSSQFGKWDLELGLGAGHCLPFLGAEMLKEDI